MTPPIETPHLVGHNSQKSRFLEALHGGRFPHGWILTGSHGIGKSTFAYHMARYLFANRSDGEVDMNPQDPIFRRVAARSHGDLLILEREERKQEITVEQARKVPHFLAQTAAEGGWRVIIIDEADRMNRSTMNGILKSLEEPPEKTVFFIITSTPGRLLPTVASRCQALKFSPLTTEQTQEVVKTFDIDVPVPQMKALLEAVKGSPGKFLDFYQEGKLVQNLAQVLDSLPLISIEPAIPFIKQGATDEKAFDIIEHMTLHALHQEVEKNVNGVKSPFPLEQSLILWEKISDLFANCRTAQLDRQATLFAVFSSLEKENL